MINWNKSCLSQEKKNGILNCYDSIIREFKKHRKEHLERVKQRLITIDDPAWVRINPTSPINETMNSYRLCIGFQNIGCKYREYEPMGLGCLNCGYYANTAFRNIDKNSIINQFRNALIEGCKTGTKFNSIEFLNDGSFLNTEEFSNEITAELLKLLAGMPHIKRVLIESKIDYITKGSVIKLLSYLKDDQMLEIGIGFESADDFVRNTCINKGFSLNEFENSVRTISLLNSKTKYRINLVINLLVKPAFLNQEESIEDVLYSLEYLKLIETKYEINIVPKLEPAVIVNGTVLSLLYLDKKSDFNYKPLSYWAILEILSRIYFNKICDSFLSKIRIGAREDMAEVLKVPAVYIDDKDEGIFHPFDFVLYQSIQKFNQHHDIYKLFSVINEVYFQFNGTTLYNVESDFSVWRKNNNLQHCFTNVLYNERQSFIKDSRLKEDTQCDISVLNTVYKVFDILGGYDDKNTALYNEFQKLLKRKDKTKKAIERFVNSVFLHVVPNELFSVEVAIIIDESSFIEILFDIQELLQDNKFSVRSRIRIV